MSNKCKIYKSCKYVPVGNSMNRCLPSYTYPNSSRNWSYCNMANWGKRYKKYKSRCKTEKNCKLIKTNKVTKNTIHALEMHKKMPYIWRFLKPQTKKLIIKLGNKSKKYINVPFEVFPEKINIFNKLKKNNTLYSKKYLNKLTKNMTQKNKQKFIKLRKMYKSI